jgi:hypothetical protein
LLIISQKLKAQTIASPPSGWGDFKFGLVNDGTTILTRV